MKHIVFDLGGTLMEYKGMSYSWTDFYEKAFDSVNNNLNLKLSASEIDKSCEIFKSYNPRINYREIEFQPDYIFKDATFHWIIETDINIIINEFFKCLELKSVIYEDSLACLKFLKENGYKIAALTDLPTAMPDELFKKDITSLIEYLDIYVSSLSCGYRKPNKHGLEYIANYFKINVCDLVFIGDEEKDIKTAKNAGCTSVLINRDSENINYCQDFTVHSLTDFMHFIKKETII